MSEDRIKNVLKNIAQRGVPENINLWPMISTRLERTSSMTTLRTRPIVVILITLLILLVLSGTVYALGRVLGYIPGIGLVEQASSLRTLEGPALVEREGIRLTVVNVIASPTSTSVRFQVEWITLPPTTGEPDMSCQGTPGLILGDGTQLNLLQMTDKFMLGEPGSNTGYGYVMEFAPVPAGQHDATFLYPCLTPLVPGPLPRDWRVPIHLIPAPEGMALPVVTVPATDVISTATAAITPSSPTLPAADPTHRIVLAVDSFVPTENGYLLIGSMGWSATDYPAYGVKPIAFTGYVNVLDANGQDIPWQEVFENVKPQNEEYRSYWAINVLSKTFTAPLTITMNAVDVQIEPVPFRFDVGSTPQAGQSWELAQDIQTADSLVHVERANLVSSDGSLSFQMDVQVDADTIGDIRIHTLLSQCMGGGGGYPVERLRTLQIYVPLCRADLPPGPVEMQVTGAVLWGRWQASWQP